MELKGKKINFLGDSITEGCGTDLRFDQIIAEQTGAVCRNYGIGGTRIARNHKPSANPLFDQYYDSRVDNMDPDADVIYRHRYDDDGEWAEAEFSYRGF